MRMPHRGTTSATDWPGFARALSVFACLLMAVVVPLPVVAGTAALAGQAPAPADDTGPDREPAESGTVCAGFSSPPRGPAAPAAGASVPFPSPTRDPSTHPARHPAGSAARSPVLRC
jgi:hypothetical protein